MLRNRPENSKFGQDIEHNKPRFSVRVRDSLWIEGLLEKLVTGCFLSFRSNGR